MDGSKIAAPPSDMEFMNMLKCIMSGSYQVVNVDRSIEVDNGCASRDACNLLYVFMSHLSRLYMATATEFEINKLAAAKEKVLRKKLFTSLKQRRKFDSKWKSKREELDIECEDLVQSHVAALDFVKTSCCFAASCAKPLEIQTILPAVDFYAVRYRAAAGISQSKDEDSDSDLPVLPTAAGRCRGRNKRTRGGEWEGDDTSDESDD